MYIIKLNSLVLNTICMFIQVGQKNVCSFRAKKKMFVKVLLVPISIFCSVHSISWRESPLIGSIFFNIPQIVKYSI